MGTNQIEEVEKMKKTKRWIVGLMIAFMFLGMVDIEKAVAQTTKLELKLQSHLIQPEVDRTVAYFKYMVEKLTQGQITIALYPVGAIVPAKEMLTALRRGVLDMVQCMEGYWAGEVPGSEAANGLPFAFQTYEEAWFFMWKGGLVDIMREEYAKHNAYYIPWEAFQTELMTKKPINRIEDLKGMKLRSSGAIAEWLKKCGASTVFIAGGELYTALATGVADGAHWGHAGPMYEMKFHEVLKYFMRPAILWGSWNQLYVNMDLWKKLTSEQRIAIETAAQAAAYFSTLHTQMLSRRSLQSMERDHGVRVTVLSSEEVEKGRNLAMETWDVIAKKNSRNAQIVDMVKAFIKDKEIPSKIKKYPW